MSASSIAARAKRSGWVSAADGLSAAVDEWSAALARDDPEQRARRVTSPGLVAPARALRYAAALEVGRLRWTVGEMLSPGLQPLRDPAGWAKQGVAQVLRHQLGMLGPAGGEVSRIIAGSKGLLPQVIVDEVQRHPVPVDPLPRSVAEKIAERSLGGRVSDLSEVPLVATHLTQLHTARLDGDRPVLVRVRRPGAAGDVAADARLTAAVARTLEQVVPAARTMHPLGFVELAARQTIEASDLRREALNLVELAMALEELGIEGITIARPVAGLATRRAVVFEDLPGARPLESAAGQLDTGPAIAGYVAAAIETGLAVGVFHADLRSENLVVLGDGTLGVVGCGTLGRFDVDTRRAAFTYLTALFGGDPSGQVDAMRMAGALPDAVDEGALVADLAAAPALSPMAMFGGDHDVITTALGDAVRILLAHGVRPPTDVVLFVRNVFAFREFLASVEPEMSPIAALLPMVQRLPDIRERLEAVPR